MNKIGAEIVADSKNEHGQRITTFVAIFPRIILSELNTHRMFSRNSASSRAIPFEKMVKIVEDDPFIPIRWQKDHKGMQGSEYFEEGFRFNFPCTDKDTDNNTHEYLWLKARDKAVKFASLLSKEGGLTKQICNRLLEPFLWHKALITSTEWENFFALRAHDQAEIHIQELAHKMLEEYNKSTPNQLKAGDWHMPFGDKIEASRITASNLGDNSPDSMTKARIRIATARCARVSYLNFEGNDDLGADIRLHQRLLESGHMSPFEHCARAMSKDEYEKSISGQVKVYNDWGGTFTSGLVVEIDPIAKGWCGNFRGFIQYRKMINGENKIDNRVIKKV